MLYSPAGLWVVDHLVTEVPRAELLVQGSRESAAAFAGRSAKHAFQRFRFDWAVADRELWAMSDVLEPPEEWQVVAPADEGSERSDDESEFMGPPAVASPWSDSLADLVAGMRSEHDDRHAPVSPSPYSPFQPGEHMTGWQGGGSTDVGSPHASLVAGASSGSTGRAPPVLLNWYRGMQCRACRLPMQHRGTVWCRVS